MSFRRLRGSSHGFIADRPIRGPARWRAPSSRSAISASGSYISRLADKFLPIMPDWVPDPRDVVLVDRRLRGGGIGGAFHAAPAACRRHGRSRPMRSACSRPTSNTRSTGSSCLRSRIRGGITGRDSCFSLSSFGGRCGHRMSIDWPFGRAARSMLVTAAGCRRRGLTPPGKGVCKSLVGRPRPSFRRLILSARFGVSVRGRAVKQNDQAVR